MAKALVIKSANFASNKLTTVTLASAKPCTSITLNQSAVSMSGGTQTLTATVLPSDCTDAVSWATSNASVATVANGVVTAVGNGTATITATCGAKTATCSVTVSIVQVIAVDWKMAYRLSVQSGTPMLTDLSSDDLVSYVSGIGTAETDYRAYDSVTQAINTHYYIKIPSNASKIQAIVPDYIKVTFDWCDSTQHTELGSKMIKSVDYSDTSAWNASISNGNREVDIPDGADSFYVCLCYRNGNITEDILADVVIKAV